MPASHGVARSTSRCRRMPAYLPPSARYRQSSPASATRRCFGPPNRTPVGDFSCVGGVITVDIKRITFEPEAHALAVAKPKRERRVSGRKARREVRVEPDMRDVAVGIRILALARTPRPVLAAAKGAAVAGSPSRHSPHARGRLVRWPWPLPTCAPPQLAHAVRAAANQGQSTRVAFCP